MSTTRIRSARLAHRGLSPHKARKILFTAALVAASLLALAPLARAAETTYTTSIGGLTLPEYIGSMEFIGERSGADPNVSASYLYRAVGMALDIRVSDLGANGVTDGIDAPQLLERYREAKEILAANTPVRRLRPKHELNVTLGEGAGYAAREALYEVKRAKNGGTTYLWFTAVHGLVIDGRFDFAPGFEEDGAISHSEILAALGAAIPASPEIVAQARARAAAAADPSVRVAILWDPATPEQESKIWLAYLYARAAFAANESQDGPAAGEREATFEEEVRGRMIAVSTFRALKREDARLASAYFSDIDRVEAAGFLREYVWSYLHRTAWVAAPQGLDLPGFDAWRAAHLLNHVPVTHGRITFRLAAN